VKSVVFVNVDGLSFIIDMVDDLWIVDEFYDDDGIECDPENALFAAVWRRKDGMKGVAHLAQMENPEIN